MMRCGKCGQSHEFVYQVKRCYGISAATTASHTVIAREPSKSPVELLKIAAAKLPNVEHARYMVNSTVYQVDKPTAGKWSGYTFCKAGVGRHAQKMTFAQQLRALEAIAADPAKAFISYGKQFGVCGVCGRELTNPESIERGIGPVCWGRIGGAGFTHEFGAQARPDVPEWTI